MSTERQAPELSPREKQLLKFAAEGLTDTAIAYRLGISEATVGTYWGRVRIKLGPRNRTELVAIMLREEREAAVADLRQENQFLINQLQAIGELGEELKYRDLLENAPDAMILVLESGTIDYANRAALDLFGYQDGELHGQGLLSLIPPRFNESHTELRDEYFRDPMRRHMGVHLETPALGKDGAEFLIRATLSAIKTVTGVVVMCVIRPAETA